MEIKLKLFASIRETMGFSEKIINVPNQIHTLGEFCQYLCQSDERWQIVFNTSVPVKMAYDYRFATKMTSISQGGEVALFPPVTGG